ncbi:hypothetical protein Tsubulata_045674 [Turnera subulata]|uniref:Late embryogenesis abundant protein LEA-2 subgroup domain-containing protein n=1 Tax=Turnera subulata TaxID=218843 RepID=A0A9Q0FCV8_9ROSI|nr:hypothetical protein Tsubulata_045674 [Turnera subulata]
MARRGLKICCGVATISILIIAIVFTSLAFTVFKPKQPDITATPTGLQDIQFTIFPNVTLNVTLDMLVTIDNPNHIGSFKFENSTAYVNYHEVVVAQVPIEQHLVPAHSKINITTFVDLMGDKMIGNPHFMDDFLAGSFNLTSTAQLHGKVNILKILNLHATAYSTCEISVFISSQDIVSNCKSKIRV